MLPIYKRTALQASAATRFNRTFATTAFLRKENISAGQGQGSPGTASNVSGNPQSVNADTKNINQSRTTDGAKRQDNASLQSPTDEAQGGQIVGEEESSAHAAVKPDSNASQQEKRKAVEQQGQKPLDAADK